MKFTGERDFTKSLSDKIIGIPVFPAGKSGCSQPDGLFSLHEKPFDEQTAVPLDRLTESWAPTFGTCAGFKTILLFIILLNLYFFHP